jgi:predicted AlkP superfamily phosphohydrolase/phosphomutase/tetratricopeptide (TPR) repeat protein
MSNRLAKRVLLIGWDAADWKVIRPLLADGKLPTLARLIDGGVSGNLATIQPMLSPMLWNSIATGKRADKHGICSFVGPLSDLSGIRPIASTSRTCKAIWNILTQAGLASNVVSWFASHPAEPIRGSIVSDRYAAQSAAWQEGAQLPAGTVHPASLAEQLAPFIVSPRDLDAAALLPFIPRAAEIDQEHDDRLAKLAGIVARTSTVHAAACQLAQQDDWDFMAVYYSAIDEFGHHFMPYHPPHVAGVSQRDAAIYGEAVAGCYQFQDMMLEALLAYAGPETTVVLVSDHGFHHSERRPSADAWQHPETWHREFGVACIHGPGIRRGAPLHGATLLDVTPTILALLGLPIGNDMDGRPWLEICAEPLPVDYVESWEPDVGDAGMHREEFRDDPVASALVMRQLIDLGYLSAANEDGRAQCEQAIKDARINRAVAVASSRRVANALPLWQELAEAHPDEPGFQFQVASCRLRLSQWDACHEAIEKLPPELRQSPHGQLLQASLAIGEERLGDALAIARGLDAAPLPDAGLYNQLGQLFLSTSVWNEAETAFRRALELLPESSVALDGLAQLSLRRNDYAAAVEQALGAVELTHFFPAAHFHLGEGLSGAGRDAEAIAAYETALGMGFEPQTTHNRLAALYRLRNPARAAQHRARSQSSSPFQPPEFVVGRR